MASLNAMQTVVSKRNRPGRRGATKGKGMRSVKARLKLNWKFANCKGSRGHVSGLPTLSRLAETGCGHSGRASKIRQEQWSETSPGEQTPGHLNGGILEKRFLEVDPRGPSNFDRKVCIGPGTSLASSFVTSPFQFFSLFFLSFSLSTSFCHSLPFSLL